jgi:hypothetical protein
MIERGGFIDFGQWKFTNSQWRVLLCQRLYRMKRSPRVTTALPFQRGTGDTFKSRRVQFFETYNAMNWKNFVLLGCVVACVFAASTATAQMGGHRGSMAQMPMQRAPMFGAMARMPMQHAPTQNSAFGFHRFNEGDFDRDDRFRRFHRFNDIIVFDNFGFPFFPFPPFPPFPPF